MGIDLFEVWQKYLLMTMWVESFLEVMINFVCFRRLKKYQKSQVSFRTLLTTVHAPFGWSSESLCSRSAACSVTGFLGLVALLWTLHWPPGHSKTRSGDKSRDLCIFWKIKEVSEKQDISGIRNTFGNCARIIWVEGRERRCSEGAVNVQPRGRSRTYSMSLLPFPTTHINIEIN